LVEPLNAYKDEVLMRTNQEDVAIFHSGEQGKLDDIIEHIKSEFSWVIEK
jgi:hypothetical protein